MNEEKWDALRIAAWFEGGLGGCEAEAAAELRRLHEVNVELLKSLDNLRRAAYWVVEGGEFWEWVKDRTMPYAAGKELDELAEMMQAAREAIAKATGEKHDHTRRSIQTNRRRTSWDRLCWSVRRRLLVDVVLGVLR